MRKTLGRITKTKAKIFAILPARNEALTISKVIIAAKKYVYSVIVVDDGSEDDTAKVSRRAKAVVLTHIVNLGKGAALKTGCDYALRQGAKILIVLDSDGQHDPKELPQFIKALKSSDLVTGVRQFDKQMPFVKRAWNFGISKLFSFLYGTEVHDQQSGFRAFTVDTYKKIRWKSTDYLVETEMLVNLLKRGLSLKEVPIKTIYTRDHGGVSPSYGFRHLAAMLLWRL